MIVISIILAFFALIGLMLFISEIKNASQVDPKENFLHGDCSERDTAS